MMDFEYTHAKEAVESGLYVTYHCDPKNHECARVGSKSMCFCGHKFAQHNVQASKKRITSKCENCPCKEFKWIPQRPEECGMYWLPRRKDFKMSEWKAKCKCKQPHDAHNPVAPYSAPGCQGFYSDFACIACDCRWEDHTTLWEFEDERKARGAKTGQAYLPLSMNAELHDIVFNQDRNALPNYNRPAPNSKSIGAKPGAKPMAVGAGPKPMAIGAGPGGMGARPGNSKAIMSGQMDDDDQQLDVYGGQDMRFMDPQQWDEANKEKVLGQFQVQKKQFGVQQSGPTDYYGKAPTNARTTGGGVTRPVPKVDASYLPPSSKPAGQGISNMSKPSGSIGAGPKPAITGGSGMGMGSAGFGSGAPPARKKF